MTNPPGIFGTLMLFAMRQTVQGALAASVRFLSRLGTPDDYAKLVNPFVENDTLDGEVVRRDGAIRLAPKQPRLEARPPRDAPLRGWDPPHTSRTNRP